MANIARVQYTTGGSFAGTLCAISLSGVTAGNLLLILHRFNNSSAYDISGWTLGGGSITPTQIGTEMNAYGVSANTARSRFYYHVVGASGGMELNLTTDISPFSSQSLAVWELSGFDIAALFDLESKSNGTSSVASGSITTTKTEEALFGVVISSTSHVTPTGILTGEANQTLNFNHKPFYCLDTDAAGVKSLDFTTSQAAWGVHCVAIASTDSVAGGGGGGDPLMGRRIYILP